nr:MAG TPA: hypothetical protein [Caudoviricetes sp.]
MSPLTHKNGYSNTLLTPQRYKYEKTLITSNFADFYSRHFSCPILSFV